MKAKFTLMRAGKKTVNGRVYSASALRKAVRECQERIKLGSMFGWLQTKKLKKLPLGNISHRVTELKFNGKGLVGEIEILDTPEGRKAKKAILSGGIGPCPFGEGRLTKTGRVFGYKFTTVCTSPIDLCDPGMSFTVEDDPKKDPRVKSIMRQIKKRAKSHLKSFSVGKKETK